MSSNFLIKDKFIHLYMDIAERVSKLSSAERLQVGTVAVKDDNILAFGYNGTPSGWDNKCETYVDDIHGQDQLVTKAEVLHAESNLIAKISKSPNSSKDALLFITHAPCLQCAKQIYQAGFKAVFYKHDYRLNEGLDFLIKCNIFVRKIN